MKAISFIFALLAVGLLVTGCVHEPIPMTVSFNPDEHTYVHKRGYGTITGQAFMRQVGGGVVTAAGEDVFLIPHTPFTEEWALKRVRGTAPDDATKAIAPYRRSTIADAGGNFAFRELVPGKYLIITTVRWGVPTQYGVATQGGMLLEAAEVQGAETVQVIMAR